MELNIKLKEKNLGCKDQQFEKHSDVRKQITCQCYHTDEADWYYVESSHFICDKMYQL